MDGSNSKKSRRARRGCSRNKRHNGGGLGTSYAFAGSVDPTNPSLGDAAEVVKFSSCGNAVSPGHLNDVGTVGGLPGFASGPPANPGFKGGRRRSMRGGTYTFVPNVVGDSKIAVPESSYQGCGEGRFSVANPSVLQPPIPGYPASFLTAPPASVPAPYPNSPTTLQPSGAPYSLLKGGAAVPPSYAVDAMVYEANKAGYSDFLPSGPTSAGPPFSIHTPYSYVPKPSQACLHTGGSKKNKYRTVSRKNKHRKGSRKNKHRKSSRKNKHRKGSRKH
jgi:hypothetical protein